MPFFPFSPAPELDSCVGSHSDSVLSELDETVSSVSSYVASDSVKIAVVSFDSAAVNEKWDFMSH